MLDRLDAGPTILDCCFSGAAGLEGETNKANDIAIAQEARNIIDTRMLESEGTYLLSSSSLAFQQYVIKKDLRLSLFTYYLIE